MRSGSVGFIVKVKKEQVGAKERMLKCGGAGEDAKRRHVRMYKWSAFRPDLEAMI
jgi:hypothetical protein